MHPAVWFAKHLEASGEAFLWAAQQAPPPRRDASPPRRANVSPLGQWSVARHAFHLLHYERATALPRMRLWLGEPIADDDPDAEATTWAAGHAFRDILAQFKATRDEQIALLAQIDDSAWHQPKDLDGCGSVTLYWVASMTYQHTAEHTSDMLRIALLWDTVVEQLRQPAPKQSDPA